MKKRKPAFGTNDGFSYAAQINTLDNNEFFKQSFGRSFEDMKKVKSFIAEAKHCYVGAKNQPTLSAIKRWIKDNNPAEFYAKWKSDSPMWKDDSTEVFYKS